MPQESESIHRLFRRRRIETGITQSELARQVGCKQSAISMFEAGRMDVLSREKLASIAERLGIAPDMLPASEVPAAPRPRSPQRLFFCPVDECPSNIPYVVRGCLHFRPTFLRAPGHAGGPVRCPWCNELLESQCPNPDCGAPVLAENSSCPRCGTPYVTPVIVSEQSPVAAEEWAEARRRLIRELRELTGAD